MTQSNPKFGPEHFPAGVVIIRQGDMPDKFYIISSGRVEVIEQQDDGIEKFIATLQAGDYFGEIGLMRQTPRNATVRALTNVDVMAMDYATFVSWLESSPVIQEELEALVRQRTGPLKMPMSGITDRLTPKKKRKRQTGFFETQGLEHAAMYAPGETIIQQGDPSEKFYIIVEGLVEVTHQNDAGDVDVVRQLGEGDFFGEIGLLERRQRNATVRALTAVQVVTFSRESFMRWMQNSPQSLAQLKETAVRRRKDTGLLSDLDD
ncbi:MAG: cyclic nucleotide-binding domain-containing protein [Chloroflexi bacterium]|nr:MAG: cyclic nucleotide-binding domain-containing protein [Chloroflexota bacterium]